MLVTTARVEPELVVVVAESVVNVSAELVEELSIPQEEL